MRNRILFKPYILFVTLSCLLFSGCSEEETYYDLMKFPVVEIKQMGYSNDNSVKVIFTPDALTSRFTYAIGTEADFENFEKETLTTIRKQNGNETFEYTFEYLNPSTHYVIFARGYNANGDAGAISSVKIKTITDAFSVKTQFVADKSAGFTVSHDDDFYKFHYYLGKPGQTEEFLNLANAEGDPLESCIEKAPEYTRYFFNLTPNTDYVFYVRGYDRSNVPTKVFEIPITTKIEDSCPGIYNFKINNLDLGLGNFTYTFNEKTSKAAYIIEELDNYDVMFDGFRGDIFEMLRRWSIAGNATTITSKTFDFTYQTRHLLISDKDRLKDRSPFDYPFKIYVLLYDENGEPYGIDKIEYTTPSFNPDAAQAEVNVEISDIIPSKATYTITPDENTKYIVFETFYAKYLDEGIQMNGDTVNPPTKEQILSILRGKDIYLGTSPFKFTENTTGHADLELCLLIAPMNENGLVDGVKEFKKVYYVAK